MNINIICIVKKEETTANKIQITFTFKMDDFFSVMLGINENKIRSVHKSRGGYRIAGNATGDLIASTAIYIRLG